jgi:hypothetical protein
MAKGYGRRRLAFCRRGPVGRSEILGRTCQYAALVAISPPARHNLGMAEPTSTRPRFQYSLSSLLVAMAFCAIALAGPVWTLRFYRISVPEIPMIVVNVMLVSPFWMPIVACAFVVGRQRVSVMTTVVFAMVEGAAVLIVYWLHA